MPSIDERIVSMAFDNAKFEAGVATTLATLTKLDTTLKNVGKTTSFSDIDKAASKVTLLGPMSALDKLKARLSRGAEGAESFSEIDKAANKVTLEGPVSALDKLKARLSRGADGAESFAGIDTAANKVTLGGITQAINTVSGQFSILQGAAAVALGNISTKAIQAGSNFAKSFTIAPIQQGFEEYSINLNSIQTILANTKASGAGLKDVNRALQELNHYSDQTIYNFSEMAKNIGTFTAAGVDLKTATGSIKGIANLAALSGSNSQQASTAMYQLSQAISAGRVSLQDWNSVVNAGMGGTVFQRALAQTAAAMGTLDENAVELKGKMKNVTIEGQSFRESITARPGEQSWLTSDVLTKTLQQFTGDLSDAELKAQGFNEEQIKAIQSTAKTAKKAATEVKTLKQVFDVAKEAIGSGWSKTFQMVFGNFTQAKKTFTDLSNYINGFINQNANARNQVLKEWQDLGGRSDLLAGFKAAFDSLLSVLEPIKEAFREIFPAKTGADLALITQQFRLLMESFKIGPETAENLKRTFKGFFAVLDIGKQILGQIVRVFGELVGAVGEGSGGFLEFTGGIGDFLTSVDQALKQGSGLTDFFDGLRDVLKAPVRLLSNLGDALGSLFGSADNGSEFALSENISAMEQELSPLERVLRVLTRAWEGFLDILGAVKDAFEPVLGGIGDAVDSFVDKLKVAFKNADYEDVFDIIQTTLIGGIFLAIKKGLGGGVNLELGGNILKNLSGVFDGVTGSLTQMQNALKAGTLLQIASAIGILAAGILVLSTIDPKKLATSMSAVAVGLGELMGAVFLLSRSGKIGAMSIIMPLIASSMILMAGAMDILALAILALSRLSWEDLAKGLIGVGGGLAAIGAALKVFPFKSILLLGAGMLPLATSMVILAGAMKLFATMDWEELGKGLVGVGGALGAIGLALKLFPFKSILLIGPGLVAVGLGLNIIAAAVGIFGSMDLLTLAKGIGAVGASLGAIALGLTYMPKGIIAQAAALGILALALLGIAGAVRIMGSASLGEIAKGLAGLGVALGGLAAGLRYMSTSMPGALALLAAAAALDLLAPALALIGNMSIETILKGLAGLALTLGVLAGAGAVASAPLTAVALALGALGVAMTLISGSVYLLAKALVLLGTSGTKGVGVMVAALTAFVAVLPKIIIDFAKGLVEIVAAIARLAPQMVGSFGKIIASFIQLLIDAAPKVAEGALVMLKELLKVLVEGIPAMVQAGFHLLIGILKGIGDNIGQVTTQAVRVIVRFLNALTNSLPRLVAAGARFLVAFLNGVLQNMGKVLDVAIKIVVKFIETLAANAKKLIAAGAKLLVNVLKGIADHIKDAVKQGIDIIVHIIDGIGEKLPDIVKAGGRAAGRFIRGVAEAAVDLANAGAQALIDFLHGLADAIEEKTPQIIEAGADVAKSFVRGVVSGIKNALVGGEGFESAVDDLVARLRREAEARAGTHKSVVDIGGEWTIGGDTWDKLGDAAKKSSGVVIDALDKTSSAIRNLQSVNPTISPALNLSNVENGFRKFQSLINITSISEGRQLNAFLSRAFIRGLTGTTDEIRQAFVDLNTKLSESRTALRKTIQREEAKLKELKSADKPNKKAIKEVNESLRANEKLLKSTSAAQKQITADLKDEKSQLVGLAKDFQKVSEQLGAAQSALDEAIRTRDDAFKSYSDQYGALPDIDTEAGGGLEAYKKSLKDRIDAVNAYRITLEKLRAIGLDDATYQKLLSEGTGGQGLADEILASGPEGVAALNQLDSQLIGEATTLAQQASANLYQAGVNAAAGLVAGLQAQKSGIRAAMEAIAEEMVNAIRKKLKIKSPSQVFAEMGKYSSQGMAQGLRTSTAVVADAAAGVGDEAVTALQSSLNRVSDVLNAEIDSNPTITPILDLSKVQADAKQLADLTNVTPITAAASYKQATSISAQQEDIRTSQVAAEAESRITEVKFEQTNNSPKALSEVEIYRNTKNLMSQAKSLLESAS